MPSVPATIDVPQTDSYIRYFDVDIKQTRFMKLTSRRGPLTYPYRFPEVAAAEESEVKTFDEINPAVSKHHLYVAFLGVSRGFLFSLWHPYDIKSLKWDEDIKDIDEGLTAVLDHSMSPYEAPCFPVMVEHNRYPGVSAKNICGETKNPEVIFLAFQYTFQSQEELPERELFNLRNGTILSQYMDFGGEL